MKLAILVSAIACLLSIPSAFAQGPNCANPEFISGVGDWNIGSVGGASGMSREVWPACPATGGEDSFFHWTAEVAGTYGFIVIPEDTTGSVYVYRGGGCDAVLIECINADLLLYGSVAVIDVQEAGTPYLLRGLGLGSSATFRVRRFGVSDCVGLAEDGYEPNDSCHEAPLIGNGIFTPLVLHETGASPVDMYRFGVASGETLDVDCTLYGSANYQALQLTLWPDPAGNAACDLASAPYFQRETGPAPSISFINTSPAFQNMVLEVKRVVRGGSQMTIGCSTYGLTVSGADESRGFASVTAFCDPMDPNSTGSSTILSVLSGTGVGSGIRLECRQGPPNQFASFIVGTGYSEPGVMLGQGRFCLSQAAGQQFGRYNVGNSVFNSIGRFDSTGYLENLVGTSQTGFGFDVPTALPGFGLSIGPGDTWHFQAWSRDVGGQSNWSNGASVMFLSLP